MATLNNNVSLGTSDVLMTNQSIGIGTVSTVNSENSSELATWGVLGAGGTATATSNVTSNQTVTLGTGTDLTASGNINLTAGDDPTPGVTSPTIIVASAVAQAYVAGGIAGVPGTTATMPLTSNTTLTVSSGDVIQSGENTTLAADPGTPDPVARGSAWGRRSSESRSITAPASPASRPART